MVPLCVFKDSWPSISPDPNPYDNWMREVIETGSDAVIHNNVDDLKDVIKSASRSNNVAHVKRAFTSFWDRTGKVVTASGGFIVWYESSNVVKYIPKRSNDYLLICFQHSVLKFGNKKVSIYLRNPV